jgi:hypothetical protein
MEEAEQKIGRAVRHVDDISHCAPEGVGRRRWPLGCFGFASQ